MSNVVMASGGDNTAAAQQQQMQQQQSQVPDLTEIPVANENVSLNLMVGFLNIAQKRGAFNLKESSKIWECIKIFQKTTGPVGPEAKN